MLGVSTEFLLYLMHRPERSYRRFSLRWGKKIREIATPRVGLKLIQKWLSWHIQQAVNLPDCVHGFVPAHSTVSAAKEHTGKDWIVSMDIVDFFGTTSRESVRNALGTLGYPDEGANVCAALTTLAGVLPQGAPSSPLLSNLVFVPVDECLAGRAAAQGWSYTRYADDLIFSGMGEPPRILPSLVGDAISLGGWRLNADKTTVQTRVTGVTVLGLSVWGVEPTLGKRKRRKLRLAKHLQGREFTVEQERFFRSFQSFLGYAQMVTRG